MDGRNREDFCFHNCKAFYEIVLLQVCSFDLIVFQNILSIIFAIIMLKYYVLVMQTIRSRFNVNANG